MTTRSVLHAVAPDHTCPPPLFLWRRQSAASRVVQGVRREAQFLTPTADSDTDTPPSHPLPRVLPPTHPQLDPRPRWCTLFHEDPRWISARGAVQHATAGGGRWGWAYGAVQSHRAQDRQHGLHQWSVQSRPILPSHPLHHAAWSLYHFPGLKWRSVRACQVCVCGGGGGMRTDSLLPCPSCLLLTPYSPPLPKRTHTHTPLMPAPRQDWAAPHQQPVAHDPCRVPAPVLATVRRVQKLLRALGGGKSERQNDVLQQGRCQVACSRTMIQSNNAPAVARSRRAARGYRSRFHLQVVVHV
jgi:hypothetical protein